MVRLGERRPSLKPASRARPTIPAVPQHHRAGTGMLLPKAYAVVHNLKGRRTPRPVSGVGGSKGRARGPDRALEVWAGCGFARRGA